VQELFSDLEREQDNSVQMQICIVDDDTIMETAHAVEQLQHLVAHLASKVDAISEAAAEKTAAPTPDALAIADHATSAASSSAIEQAIAGEICCHGRHHALPNIVLTPFRC
jgi:hypothetical protein